jgi:hypothetical protein
VDPRDKPIGAYRGDNRMGLRGGRTGQRVVRMGKNAGRFFSFFLLTRGRRDAKIIEDVGK